jgi:hypothetical protein
MHHTPCTFHQWFSTQSILGPGDRVASPRRWGGQTRPLLFVIVTPFAPPGVVDPQFELGALAGAGPGTRGGSSPGHINRVLGLQPAFNPLLKRLSKRILLRGWNPRLII